MELLKALIAFGARDVTEELLAESLWPGVDRDYSYRSLTTTIHRLRKLLGEDKVISVQDGRLGLNEQYCWLDTWAYEQIIEELENLLDTRDSLINDDDLNDIQTRIFQLYKGPLWRVKLLEAGMYYHVINIATNLSVA